MASLLGLVSYGGSDSEEEEEERGGTGKLNETSDKDTTALKKTPLLKHEKDKSGKVRVYLPDFNKKANTTTGSSTDLHKVKALSVIINNVCVMSSLYLYCV